MSSNTQGAKISRWYEADKKEVHRELTATVEHIATLDRPRIARMRSHMRMYNPDVSGSGSNMVREILFRAAVSEFNLIKQVVETVASQIAPHKPKPQYIVTDGSFDLQRIARLRTRVLEGQLDDSGAYAVMPHAFYDALITGTGHVAAYNDPDTGKPKVERCLPGEILVDPRDGAMGNPRCKYRRRAIARDVLRDLYDVSPALLQQAGAPRDGDTGALFLPRDRTIDEVFVTEAYYSPAGDDKRGGRHVIALSSTVLVDEEWEQEIPIVPIYWQKRQVGYWGLGIPELGEHAQDRLDRLMERIEYMQHLGSTAWVVCDKRSEVRVERLTNEPLSIVRHSGMGAEPKIQVFAATPNDLVQEVDRIRERFLSMCGVSVMAAEAKRPAGLDSAPAQRTYEEITNSRHAVQAKEYEAAYMRLVEILEQLNARAQDMDRSYSVAARTQRGLVPLIKTVKWSDANLPPEQYRITCFPTSQLPNTVAGRIAALQEWVASGFISRPYAQKQVIDMPDDDMQRLELADLDFVMWQIEEILDGKVVSPESYQNKELAADTARRAYLQVKSQGAPEEILDTLRNFIDDCLPPPPPEETAAPNAPALPMEGMGAPPESPQPPAPPLQMGPGPMPEVAA